MENESEDFYEIAKEIVNVFGKIFAARPYIAVLDALGNVRHIDEPLSESHLNFVQDFVRKSCNLLKVGDYSFPLGGINLGFFKISEKAVIVLYTTKGFTGQLLAFKARMHDWSQKIDELIGEIDVQAETIAEAVTPQAAETTEIKPPVETKKYFRDFPILIKDLTGKEKFPMEVAQVLNLCDGKHSIEDICMELEFNIIHVKDILAVHEKKKWIKIKRVLG